MVSTHQYELVERNSGRQVCIVSSRTRIEGHLFPGVIYDAVMAIEYLRLTDKDVAEKYELRHIGTIVERKPGWG